MKPRLIGQGALRALALVSLLWIGIAADCWAQADNSSAESQVKAAFLYKFLNFVEWPPQSFASGDSPIVIGVVGADRIA
ncbi:MAG TPA: YfiR family protein, partial [Rhizobacter sp.]|nr:YfiR family protein [Rhizobacter sp.]